MQLTIEENLDLELATARKLGKVPEPKPDWAIDEAWAQASRPRIENNPGQPHMSIYEREAREFPPIHDEVLGWPFNQLVRDDLRFQPERAIDPEVLTQTMTVPRGADVGRLRSGQATAPGGGTISGRMTSAMPSLPSLRSLTHDRDAIREMFERAAVEPAWRMVMWPLEIVRPRDIVCMTGIDMGVETETQGHLLYEAPACPHLPDDGPRDPVSSRQRNNPYINEYDVHRCWWVRYVHAKRARTLRRRGEVVVFAGWHHGRCVYKWWRNGDEGRM